MSSSGSGAAEDEEGCRSALLGFEELVDASARRDEWRLVGAGEDGEGRCSSTSSWMAAETDHLGVWRRPV